MLKVPLEPFFNRSSGLLCLRVWTRMLPEYLSGGSNAASKFENSEIKAPVRLRGVYTALARRS